MSRQREVLEGISDARLFDYVLDYVLKFCWWVNRGRLHIKYITFFTEIFRVVSASSEKSACETGWELTQQKTKKQV